MSQANRQRSHALLARWCNSVLQVTGWRGTCRTLGVSGQARLGSVFCLKSPSIKSPADNSTIIQAGKSHCVLIKFHFFVTVFQTASPQCAAILHKKKKKKGWFNPLWLWQLQTVFTKLNSIRNWADAFSRASRCRSAPAQLGKRVLRRLSKPLADGVITKEMVHHCRAAEMTRSCPPRSPPSAEKS